MSLGSDAPAVGVLAKEKKVKAAKPKQEQGQGKKKETKLGLTAKKDEDFGEWYSQVRLECAH